MDGYRLATGKAVDDVIDDIASDIDRAVNRRLLTSYTDNMTRAVQGVFPDTGYGSRYHDIAHRLEANAARFAAYKAYHATEQVKRQLTSPGTPDECRQRARGALRAFNRYQAAEYNTAVARCRTARQWIGFDDTTHRELFPHLRWLPSRSATPREQHMPYYNRVWAKDDPFWTQNQPGNLWNCKCDWEETADDIDHDGVTVTPPPPSLAGNPAITGEIFTDKAAYIANAGKKSEGIVERANCSFLQKKAKNHPLLQKQTTCVADGVNYDVEFTRFGIEEYAQSMYKDKNYWLKNTLLDSMPDIIKNAQYIGKKVCDTTHNSGRKLKIKQQTDYFYYYRISLPGGDSAILHLGRWKNNHKMYLYTITNKVNI